MINPSANGWIDKFFSTQKNNTFPVENNALTFYEKTRKTGFIYGHPVSINTILPIDTKGWLENETSKVSLLSALYAIYTLKSKDFKKEKFIIESEAFYNQMNPQGFNLFKKVLPNPNPSLNLEKIIDLRVQTNIDIVSKNFSPILTNALLFIDVLAFHQYLIHGKIPDKYLIKIEEIIINVVSLALKTKSNKSSYDDLLIKLFESSVRYSKFSKANINAINLNIEQLELSFFTQELEKYYLIDMAGLALWSDGVIENNEAYFLHKLAEALSISDDFVYKSSIETNDFISKNIGKISYFNYSSPVKNFYEHTTQNVTTLITRNKNRLVKEITQSKELMHLIAESTKRDLDEKEKKKIKKQLLEICKSIPSLTIFLLPGGSLLLPILVRFIPTLLPSAFNENLDTED
jgi:hypothetical protein